MALHGLLKNMLPVIFMTGFLICDAKAADNSSKVNNLRITNRAQCAVDSDVPTDTIFMIVDGYNAGKLANSLAKNVGLDPGETSLRAMQDFRIAVSRLSSVVINKVLSGSLPLLPLNLKTSKLTEYNSLVAQCDKKTYCPELNGYLSRLWKQSEVNSKPSLTSGVNCFYVKKFSGIQGQLHTTDLNVAALQEMAQAYIHRDDNITSCENKDPGLDSRNSILQLDLQLPPNSKFPSYGFDFWNTVKIYLSYAWRDSAIPSQVSPEFGELFKSIALEEAIMMVPNGCKSIEKPECDSETLSLNSIRELAKPGSNPTDSNREIPQGPQNGAISNGARSVNDDFLGTRGYQDASDWVENFRKNYVQNRGAMKNRLQSAVQFLNVLSAAMSSQELVEYVKPLALSGTYDAPARDELYYLCTETRLAGDQRIDFMKSGIDQMKKLTVMQKAFQESKMSLDDLSTYFDQAATGVVSYCDQLEKANIWNAKGYQVNRGGFNSWAKELLNIPSQEVTPAAPPLTYGRPALLVWDMNRSQDADNVICVSGIDCARKLTKAMVDLYAVAKYADAFLPVSSTVSSPDIFNPYADLKACKIYDPWFETRRANKRLFADLASTALFGWNMLPLYIDVDFTAPRVTSLHEMIANGSVKFDPKIDKGKMQASLLADFGPLIGAPCAVAIAPNSMKAFNFYAFSGVTLNYCDVKSKGKAVGGNDGSVDSSTPNTRSYCGGCSINFVGVASGASALAGFGLPINPVKMGIYFFRSIYRFVNSKKDKVNRPISADVNLVKVAEAYQRYGGLIPDYCVPQLGAGVGCYQNLCTAKAVEFFESYTGRKIQSIDYEGPKGTSSVTKSVLIRSSLCDGDVRLSFNCSDDGKNFDSFNRFGGMYGMNKACRDVIGQNVWGH